MKIYPSDGLSMESIVMGGGGRNASAAAALFSATGS
jgi:hypothetical protein